MTRSQKRRLFIIIILALLLLLLGWYYLYYRSTHKLTFDTAPVENSAVVQPPQFLFSFNTQGKTRMQRPVGVLADGNEVFVVDSARPLISVYNQDGKFLRSFGASQTVVPLYIAKNPKDGNLYVSDRRTRSVHIFTRAGKYLREFNPKLPKSQLPDFDTKGVQWAPVALSFAPDGTLYATEILKGHRVLIFGPDGKFKRSVGNVGIVQDAKKAPGVFQFPNGIAVHGKFVYVADSNNRRVQVLDLKGESRAIIVTEGLPRGIAFLNKFPSDTAKTPGRFVIVDTLAHDATIWADKGEKIVSFGQQGLLDGQFNYPNSVSVGSRNRIFITDSANGRVQVWGWPEQVSIVPVPRVPRNWGWCFTPLLLFPLMLFFRRQRFVASRDFIETMLEAGEIDLMPARRRRWIVSEEDYEKFKDVEQAGIKLSELLEASEYSDSDVRALMDKLEITKPVAIVLSLGQRARVLCAEDLEMRRLAKLNEIDTVNRIEFIERFTKRSSSTAGDGE
ncbi:MAG TPA: hypothetical protein VFG89_04790 [Coriobacteriia bacterium]|nr:hypothetical protein [Coriobacteriia bacterium]